MPCERTEVQRVALNEQALWRALDAVPDPEIPVISIVELGVVRAVTLNDDGHCTLTLTPTYSGCPALDVMRDDAEAALRAAGCASVAVHIALKPAWSTNDLSDAAKEKMRQYGIAPPMRLVHSSTNASHTVAVPLSQLRRANFGAAAGSEAVACPRCNSPRTVLVASHGATACQAQYRCLACAEPFDHFKPH